MAAAASEEDASGEAAFDDFSAAEAASEHIVEKILDEGGKLLYDHYIEKKSYGFAAEMISQMLVAELKLCFVRFDEGELGATKPPARALSPSSPRQVTTPMARQISSSSQASPPLVAVSPPPTGRLAGDAANFHEGEEPELVDGGDMEEEVHDGWALEEEPPRCRVDTWARACVPIRRKLVQPKRHQVAEEQSKLRLRSTGKGSSGSHRSASRQGTSVLGKDKEMNDTNKSQETPLKAQMIPLADEREEDEEEAELRDRKDREARRKREEETRLQQKAAVEAEEAARLAQVKDQMKNKPFTYDSKGDIIWVQPLPLHKMPVPNPTPGFSFKKEMPIMQSHDSSPRPAPKGQAAARDPMTGRLMRQKTRRDPDFAHGFTPFASQQPAMVEAMNLQPGVGLTERGRARSGGDSNPAGSSKMTRKEYESMVAAGTQRSFAGQRSVSTEAAPRRKAGSPLLSPLPPPSAASASPRAADPSPAPESPSGSAVGGGPFFPDAAGEEAKTPVMRVVRAGDLGVDLIPQAPTSARAPATSFRRVQLKREALGYHQSTRERVATASGSRYPGCQAQPPIGATMGHGLAAGSQKTEDFYYPAAEGKGGSVQEFGDAYPGGGSVLSGGVGGTPKAMPQGSIVSQNPALARKFFPR